MAENKPITTDTNGDATWLPQPKVVAGAVTGIALTVVVGAIAAITPEHFEALGIWGGVIYGGVVSLGSALGAYIKRPSDVS